MFSFFRKKKIDPKARLKKVLGNYVLPSFSGTVVETLRRIRDPESSATSVAETLSVDPGLTVRVLRMANSAAFSPVKKVENLNQAVALIGLSQLESMVLSVAVGTTLPRDRVDGYDFKRFWQASVRRAVVARSLASVICPSEASESFTSGFLQDQAIPFLAKVRPDEYGSILEAWSQDSQDLAAMERSMFDWDHAEVATWLCSEWDLPERTASAIGGHHGNDDGLYVCPPPVQLVSMLREVEDSADNEALIEQAHRAYGVSKDQTVSLLDGAFEASKDLAKLIA